jgi:pimeloyl-ACP methyl ester carboxylesterase
MTPFYFGSGQRRLFGCYDAAQENFGKVRAVLLCYPVGNEHIFAYRTMRLLAARLVEAGLHVLRFDYFGTGDSYGDTGEADLASWCGDIETAIEELKEITGATKVNLVGLRVGANLSARVAAHRRKDISKLVLWEPLTADELAVAGFGRPAPRADCNQRLIESDTLEGFARGAGILSQAALLPPPPSTLVLLTTGPPSPTEFGPLTVEYVAEVSAWVEERLDTGSIPVRVLRRVVDWLQ